MNASNQFNLTSRADIDGIANNSKPEHGDFFLPTVPGTIIDSWFAATTAISTLGTIGFLTLLVVLTNQPGCLRKSKLLLFLLIIFEFTLCAVHLPRQNVKTLYATKHLALDSFDCRNHLFFYVTSLQIGNWISVVIAATRFVAVCWPRYYTRTTTSAVMILTFSIVIAVCVSLNLPLHLLNVFETVPPFNDCGIHPTLSILTFLPAWMFIGSFIPVIGVVVIYLILFMAVGLSGRCGRSTVETNVTARTSERRAFRRRIAFTRMLFASSLWYSLCFLPSPICIFFFPEFFFGNLEFQLWSRTLFLSGYALNPVIFLSMNTDYRRSLKDLLQGRCSGFNARNVNPSSTSRADHSISRKATSQIKEK